MQPDSHPNGGYVAQRVIFPARRSALAAAAVLALLAGLAPGCRRPAAAPSVLLIVIDTLRADHVGALRTPAAGSAGDATPGGRPSATPSLDRWAAGSARFVRASTPAPFTMPAMAALLAGVYPDRCGLVAHESGATFGSWPGSTLPEVAAGAGLATAAVIANPWLARTTTGFDRGFAEFSRLYQPGEEGRTNSAAAVTEEAIRILSGLGDRRFFVWVHYFDPHMPYEPPAEFARVAGADASPSRVMTDFDRRDRDLGSLYRGEGYSAGEIGNARRLYEGEVRYVDREVGRLLDRLGELGLSDDTLVIVASDHGESLGEHGLFFAHDFTLYEELTRAVLLVRGPGVAAGARTDLVSLLDVAPTVCRLAALPCDGGFDGRDLFTSPRGGRTLFAAATPMRRRGATFERLQVPGVAGRWTMALDDSRKFLRIPTSGEPVVEMYDPVADPAELTNLATADRASAEGLAAKLSGWTSAMEAARPAPAAPKRPGQRRRDERTLRSLGYLQ